MKRVRQGGSRALRLRRFLSAPIRRDALRSRMPCGRNRRSYTAVSLRTQHFGSDGLCDSLGSSESRCSGAGPVQNASCTPSAGCGSSRTSTGRRPDRSRPSASLCGRLRAMSPRLRRFLRPATAASRTANTRPFAQNRSRVEVVGSSRAVAPAGEGVAAVEAAEAADRSAMGTAKVLERLPVEPPLATWSQRCSQAPVQGTAEITAWKRVDPSSPPDYRPVRYAPQ